MRPIETPTDELDVVREKLAAVDGPLYWQSLEHAAQGEAFQAKVHNEFPGLATTPITDLTRRNFLQVMGASLALAGVTTGCARQPPESIFPYVKPPEEILPGVPLFFASACVSGGFASGVLVESHMGRPTKIEGNPDHPSSLGAADAQMQATILDLYDPDRAAAVKRVGRISSWDVFVAEAKGVLNALRPAQGEGVHLLTESVMSPTLGYRIDAFLKANPKAKWHQYEPEGRDSVREGARLAFGEYVDTIYHFDKADVVVSLDSDFVMDGPGHVRYAKDFAARRDLGELDEHDDGHHTKPLNRLYAFESTPTNVGSTADHRYSVRPSQVESVARAIASKLGVNTGNADPGEGLSQAVDAIAEDLQSHRGKSIVIAGNHQPAKVHAVAHAINVKLGNTGSTVTYLEPIEAKPVNQTDSLSELVDDMNAGHVELLLIVGGNPVYNAPSDLKFGEVLNAVDEHGGAKVKLRAHLSRYEDETSELCHWQLPELHYLESWGDARAHDGTVSLIQPMIAPLHPGAKTAHELFSALTDESENTSHDIVQEYWKKRRGENDFDRFWKTSLSDGIMPNTGAAKKTPTVNGNLAAAESTEVSGLEVVFRPDPLIGDGTFSNNAWLQEQPNPLTTLTWDNAVLMGYSTAKDRGLKNGDVVSVSFGEDRHVEGPIWVQPGHALDTITLHLGYGRTRAGMVGNGHGFNAYTVRTSSNPGIDRGAEISKTGAASVHLATTEDHYNITERYAEMKRGAVDRRGIVREFTQAAYDADSHIVQEGHHDPAHEENQKQTTFYDTEEKAWSWNAWGMTIDLNKCTGCGACSTACQSENIIPVVGKDETRYGREMSWIRIDRYYQGEDPDNPRTHFQPVTCMHCENAHCELVCPVGATQHSKEGLNEMIYNRCIGTRYCSNNCPYKVRRFNFYNYTRTPFGMEGRVHPEILKPMRNPDVTVRTRGVMEKCTYCVQRINLARIDSKKRDEDMVPDGNIITACQQACPSSAIVFGNINDEESVVTKLKKSHRNYGLLADLNTRPRTTYLARLTNPNPALTPGSAAQPETPEETAEPEHSEETAEHEA